MATKKAVATVEDNFPTERPAWMAGDTARGNEGVTTDDMTIPRLSIIQDLSPQWKRGKEEFIDGAEPKMIFNTATGKLYGNSVTVIPVLFRKEWVIWKEIDAGGGFRGAFPDSKQASQALVDLDDAAQCEIVDTHQQFVLVIEDDGTLKPAAVSMSKSQCKPSRQWNTMVQDVGGDRFSRAYRLQVVDAKNSAGQEYYNWKVHQMGFVSEDQYHEAEKLYKSIRAGAMDVKRDQDARDTHAQGEVTADAEF